MTGQGAVQDEWQLPAAYGPVSQGWASGKKEGQAAQRQRPLARVHGASIAFVASKALCSAGRAASWGYCSSVPWRQAKEKSTLAARQLLASAFFRGGTKQHGYISLLMQTSGIYGEMFNRPLPVGIAGARLQGQIVVFARRTNGYLARKSPAQTLASLRGDTKFARNPGQAWQLQKRQGCHPEKTSAILNGELPLRF